MKQVKHGKQEKEVERKFTIKNLWIHLKTISIHKYYVFIYMCKCGMPIRGLLHDLSKFSPTEFFTNVKYVEKGTSPINIEKKELGYSLPWQHHKGHNPHHYEYWMDRFDDGCYVHRMPYKYMVECLCDQLAANKAYSGRKATYIQESKWWKEQRNVRNMHPDNIKFLDRTYSILSLLENVSDEVTYMGRMFVRKFSNENEVFDKKFLHELYRDILIENNNPECVKIKQPEEK